METTPFAAFRSRGSTLADLTDWLGDKLDKSLMRVSSPFLLIEVGSISSLRSKMYLSSNLTTWNTRRLPWRRNEVACDASTWWPVVSQTLSSGSLTSYVVPLRSETSTVHVYASFSQPWYKKNYDTHLYNLTSFSHCFVLSSWRNSRVVTLSHKVIWNQPITWRIIIAPQVTQAQRGIQSLRTRQKREKKRLEASPF